MQNRIEIVDKLKLNQTCKQPFCICILFVFVFVFWLVRSYENKNTQCGQVWGQPCIVLIFVFVFVLSVYFGWSGPMKAKVCHLGRSAMHELCLCICLCLCILVFHWSGPMKAKVRNFGRSEVSHAWEPNAQRTRNKLYSPWIQCNQICLKTSFDIVYMQQLILRCVRKQSQDQGTSFKSISNFLFSFYLILFHFIAHVT